MLEIFSASLLTGAGADGEGGAGCGSGLVKAIDR
jgi:hypothetical protein